MTRLTLAEHLIGRDQQSVAPGNPIGTPADIAVVDVIPWEPEGNYSHTVVEGNTILGGFATSVGGLYRVNLDRADEQMGNASLGENNASAIIKIGIAIGPDVWWGDR